MKTKIENLGVLGDCLIAQSKDVKIGIALDFGIRVSYLSFKGSENLFFVQPEEMTDLSTPDGWRVRGGHRLWIAPESEKHYYPDNAPVSYEIAGETIIVRQTEDPWLKIEKSIELSFVKDNLIKVVHKVKNTDTVARKFAPWAITNLSGGGKEIIALPVREGGFNPLMRYSTWDYASLGDERLDFSREEIAIKHVPNGKKFKLGVGHPKLPVKYINHGVVFSKTFDIYENKTYPDGDVSFETYMCDYAVELESLAPTSDVSAGETVSHTEFWHLEKE